MFDLEDGDDSSCGRRYYRSRDGGSCSDSRRPREKRRRRKLSSSSLPLVLLLFLARTVSFPAALAFPAWCCRNDNGGLRRRRRRQRRLLGFLPDPAAAAATAAARRSSAASAPVRMSLQQQQQQSSDPQTTNPEKTSGSTNNSSSTTGSSNRRSKQQYQRKRAIPETELQLKRLRRSRQAQYDKLLKREEAATTTTTTTTCSAAKTSSTSTTAKSTSTSTSAAAKSSKSTSTTSKSSTTKPAISLWSFESLFPDPITDEESVQRDLYGDSEDGAKQRSTQKQQQQQQQQQQSKQQQQPFKMMKSSFYGGGSASMMRIWRTTTTTTTTSNPMSTIAEPESSESSESREPRFQFGGNSNITESVTTTSNILRNDTDKQQQRQVTVDRDMTRRVEDSIFGYRRTPTGTYEYDTSLMGDGAIQFRDGVRLGNPLRVNADRLNYLAKKELQHGRVEEAQELLERAVEIDPRDGRAYLGLSRCAQRRRDFKLAREYLRTGIGNSVAQPPATTATATSTTSSATATTGSSNSSTAAAAAAAAALAGQYDKGANPFLLQALGCLEERTGRLPEAEALYLAAVKSRPSHAAAWVSLAQIRTRKLGQSASAGRVCYQQAERELQQSGLKPSSYVYTAWADLEYKKAGDTRRARELFKKALEVDPKCSAAWLQMGVMEANRRNYDDAQKCFESVLKFDQRNSRVLQAYAIMETNRPDGSSRKAIDLFERALKANPRDAAVLQAYALYVSELGDVESARSLLKRGTEVNKRHAPLWQAWGVLETRHGNSAEEARSVFQQGIWACAQLSGSQSGGYHCARLWQAWGVLEAREKEHEAARRCFSRALDADSRNVPTVTAWAQMEEELGNVRDARAIFESALPKFAAGSDEKVSLWRSYELMEQRLGNKEAAQRVYQRSVRDSITIREDSEASVAEILVEAEKQRQRKEDEVEEEGGPGDAASANSKKGRNSNASNKNNGEVEVIRWNGGNGGEVWLNDRAIETKVPPPFMMMNKNKKKAQQQQRKK